MKRKLISLCEAKESSQHREGRGRQHSVLDWRDLQIASVLLSTNNRLIIESSECRTLFYSIYIFFYFQTFQLIDCRAPSPIGPKSSQRILWRVRREGGRGEGGRLAPRAFLFVWGNGCYFFFFFSFYFFHFFMVLALLLGRLFPASSACVCRGNFSSVDSCMLFCSFFV